MSQTADRTKDVAATGPAQAQGNDADATTTTAAAAASKPSFESMLDAVPVPNTAVSVLERTEHTAVLRVPLNKSWVQNPIVRWFLPGRDHRKLQLDPLGTFAFDLCDGQRNIEQIIEAFAKHYAISFHEARYALTPFLQMLTQHGLVAIVGMHANDPDHRDANAPADPHHDADGDGDRDDDTQADTHSDADANADTNTGDAAPASRRPDHQTP